VLAALVAVSTVGCARGFTAPAAPEPAEIPSLEVRAASAPDDADLLIRLGAAYRGADRLDDAARVLESALEADPSSDGATFFLGLVYDEMGADSSAVALYRRYLDENPDGALRDEIDRRLTLARRRARRSSVTAALAREQQLASAPPEPRTVAVFPFVYTGPDARLRPLGRALAEMLTTDLSQTDRLTVLERLRVQLLLDEIALGQSGRVDPATAARGGRILGAARAIEGVIDGTEAEMLMEAVVVPVTEGGAGALDPISSSSPAQRFFDMEKEIVLAIYEAVGIQLTPAERERVLHRPTENLEALLAFGLGLEAQDAGRYSEAAGHFSQAAEIDPGFDAAATLTLETGLLANAADLDLDVLAATGYSEFGGDAGLDDWSIRQTTFRPIEGLLPDILGRDAVPELLGQEGFVPSSSTIEIIFRRPGGDR